MKLYRHWEATLAGRTFGPGDRCAQRNEGIRKGADSVAGLISEIAKASRDQAEGIQQLNATVGEMDQVVQRNAANAEESTGASEELSAEAVELDEMVSELVAIVRGEPRRLGQAGE